MSQTAKVQEPSMEEILASIRRIIADDDASKVAKPPEPAAATVPAAPPPQAPGLPPAPPPAAVANSQDDIDAMLANLDPQVTAPGSDVLDLTEAMAAPTPETDAAPAATFRTIDAASDVIFTDRAPDPPSEPALRIIEEPRRPVAPHAPAPKATPASKAPAAPPPAPERALISASTDRGGGQRVQFARAHRDRAERAHARGSGEGNAASAAQVLARRQSARAWSTASCGPRSSASRADDPSSRRVARAA